MSCKLTVNTSSEYTYNIHISSKTNYAHLQKLIKNKEVLVVTNATIASIYLSSLKKALSSCLKLSDIILNDGEIYKNNESLQKIYDYLIQEKYTRNAIIIAFGGGVIGDIAGFAAATYKRGVTLIQVPTTLLAQVDSSVGGKTAINHPSCKNIIGAFYQPIYVYSSIEFYKTLPVREYISGLAEVVKYACICDRDFFYWLDDKKELIRNKNTETLKIMIHKCCQIKANIISKDEFDLKGIRALLNLGHTFGHAIESCENYQGLKHGEAVGAGIILAARFSEFLGYLTNTDLTAIENLLNYFDIPVISLNSFSKEDYILAMINDKKNSCDNIIFILMQSIGVSFLAKDVPMASLELFLDDYFIE